MAESWGTQHYYLVAIDREGAAHRLTGTLAPEMIGPQVLEVLESSRLWAAIEPHVPYSASQLRARCRTWPRNPHLGGCFLTTGPAPLGALLTGETPSPDSGGPARDGLLAEERLVPPSAAEVALLRLVLQHWRLGQEAGTLGDFARALVSAQQGGVLAIDGQGRVTYLSQRGEEILGVGAREALGADCARIMRPAVDGEHPLLRGLRGDLERVELYITNRAGRDLPVSVSLSRIVDPHGRDQGLVCFFRDLSEERALDQEARRRERLAVIGELAAGAAHEIRNPLTGIGNCAQVLQMRLSDHDGNRRLADLILQETQRLDRIIASLLGFARPGQPRMRETRIEEVVRSSLHFEQPVYEKKGIRCEMRVVGMMPTIYADPEQIQQVMVNLLRNAAAAMPDGGLLSLEVSAVRRRRHMRRRLGRRATDRLHVPSDGPLARFVRVRVADTGTGISRDALPRIFDPFFTTRSEGTGLGLSVSQTIIQEHGGYISVQSVHGKGTVFEVDLPVERRQGERRKESAKRDDAHPGRG
jgi:PAS domain S-box-containing protein